MNEVTWETMVLQASQSIEADLAAEKEKNQRLARELTRAQFEKEVLINQVEDLQEKLNQKQKFEAVELQKELQSELSNEITVLKKQLSDLNELLVQRIKDVKQTPKSEKISVADRELKLQMEKFVEAASNRKAETENQAEQLLQSKIYQDYIEQLKRAERLEAVIEDNLYVQKARQELMRERLKFREIASALHREVEYLKQIYPIRGLLKAKTLEIERVMKALHRLPKNHPERIAISKIIEDHQEERSAIEKMLGQMEQRLEKQAEEIQSAMTKAGPASEQTASTLVDATAAIEAFDSQQSIAERVLSGQSSPRSSRLFSSMN